MAVVMTPIYTQTVGSSAVGSITFNNIPQYYTDLKLVISARSNAADFYEPVFIKYNSDASNVYSDTLIYANPPSVYSTRNSYGASGKVMIGYIDGNTTTANTFGNLEFYLPNYTSSNFKQGISDGVTENNSSTAVLLNLSATLYRSSSAITTFTLSTNGGSFMQYSTFSLYGIIRYGA